MLSKYIGDRAFLKRVLGFFLVRKGNWIQNLSNTCSDDL